MRHLLAALAIVLAPIAARADAITDVIADQLGAFEARDVSRAWAHASPTIHEMFGTPRNFAAMVESGYGVIWNNAQARFLGRRAMDGRAVQDVLVIDAAGRGIAYEYDMIETPQGWKINGVRPKPERAPAV